MERVLLKPSYREGLKDDIKKLFKRIAGVIFSDLTAMW